MTTKVNFVKMHGLGNDFVIINKRDLPYKRPGLSELAIEIANRRFGIGCDQFILYEDCDNFYEMTIFNSDGSSAQMCGNATRCLAKLIYLDAGKSFVIIKCSGKHLHCDVKTTNSINVNVGSVSFNETWMPSNEKILQLAEKNDIYLKRIICVDVGNPHLVIFNKLNDEQRSTLGQKFQDSDLFPDGVNVNFVDLNDDNGNISKMKLSVWERGTGLTLACGSGACASFGAALKMGLIQSPCDVIFDRGGLRMAEDANGNVIMQGPAALVARGEYYLNTSDQ